MTSTIRRMESYENPGMSERAEKLNRRVEATERAYNAALDARAREAQAQLNAGHPAQVVGIRFGVARQTVYNWIKRLEDK